MKHEIITICGSLGSGKSSTADLVAKTLGYRRFSSGDFFRQVAVDLGITVTELNKRSETDTSVDEMTDQKIRDLRDQRKIVIDSRTAWHWIPESFKVYLDLPPEVAKHRVVASYEANQLRRASEGNADAEEVYQRITERFASEQKRYWDLYKIDNTVMANYDLVIDTNENNLEEVVSIILKKYQEWLG